MKWIQTQCICNFILMDFKLLSIIELWILKPVKVIQSTGQLAWLEVHQILFCAGGWRKDKRWMGKRCDQKKMFGKEMFTSGRFWGSTTATAASGGGGGGFSSSGGPLASDVVRPRISDLLSLLRDDPCHTRFGWHWGQGFAVYPD